MNQVRLAAIVTLGAAFLMTVGCESEGEEVVAPDAPAAVEAAAPAGAAPTGDQQASAPWTCAAFCLGSYTCSLEGSSKWDKNFRTGAGRTAAEAFQSLNAKCEADGAVNIVKGFTCLGGQPQFDWASLSDACAPTR